MEASDIKKIKNLENRALKDGIEKTLTPACKRTLVAHVTEDFSLSIWQTELYSLSL